MVITLKSVEMGKNDYWIRFECYNGILDINRLFHIEYSGTDVIHDMSLSEIENEKLKLSLNNDFGYAPFNIKEMREVLKKHRGYVFR